MTIKGIGRSSIGQKVLIRFYMSLSTATLERLRGAIWPTIELRYELPRGILGAIAEWETRGTWRNDQVGPTGARGIFQLTPIALEQVRLDSGGVRFDPLNPVAASVAAGIWNAAA
ncbi:MAG: hypothetical protein EBT70_17525 [Betaproteobacteria bacterium]|nr:hypothetical protein [Betaproteobacteria bacterium]